MTKGLFDVFRDAMMHNPKGSRKEAQDLFIEQMRSDVVYLDLLARDYFTRMSAAWEVREENLGYSFGRTEVSADKIERASRAREESRTRTASAFAELKARVRDIILLDLTLPDGKVLRHATGAECSKAGGFYAEIAKHIKPQQVVDRHLSEGDLQNIRTRFYQSNAA